MFSIDLAGKQLSPASATGPTSFGIERDRYIAVLEDYLARVKSGKIHPQQMHLTTSMKIDDFPMRWLILEFFEHDDPVPATEKGFT